MALKITTHTDKLDLGELEFVPVAPGKPVDWKWFPDFLIAGPQRTGTTWLHKILEHHPQVLVPERKELFFFSQRTNKPRKKDPAPPDLQAYLRHFRYPPRLFWHRWRRMWRMYREFYRPRLRGEATATYAALPDEAIAEITRLNPELKVILMLRDPVERGWSHAKKTLARQKGGVEEVSDEEFRKYFGTRYQKRCGSYSVLMEAWSRHLKPGHLFLGLFEDLSERPVELLLEIYRFLGVRDEEKYTRQHLTDRINSTGQSAVPERFEPVLREIFAEERRYLDQLRQEIREKGPVR